MKKITALLFLAVMPILVTAQDILPSDQDIQSRFFGLELGQTVTEHEIVQSLQQNCNAQVSTLATIKTLTIYRVNDIDYNGYHWNQVILNVVDGQLTRIDFLKFFPHDFNFAWMDNDSLKTISASIRESLVEKYGNPNATTAGDMWFDHNAICLFLNSSAVREFNQTPISKFVGNEEGYILSLRYEKNEPYIQASQIHLDCGPEFDPEAFRLPEGTTIRDVILKLPGTTIDSLNNIYVGGKLVSNKLFDDKHSTQYVTYCDEVKYKLNLTVSVPESSMLFCENTPNNTVFFGPMLPDFRTLPIFESGPVVQLTDHCQVLLMSLAYQQKPRPESYPLVRPVYVPPVDGWMLNNCKVPWANWYLTNTGGVVIKDVSEEEKREAEETRLEAVRKAQEMRAKYETTVSDTVLLNQVNCNSIYIAQLPNIETIQCSDQALIANESLNQRLKKDCTSCYAVEFYKSSSFIGFDMIFFISGQENKTITDYVALLAKYLNFN